jgi:hypothetical protein
MSQALEVYNLSAQQMGQLGQLQSQCGSTGISNYLGYVQQVIESRPNPFELVIEKIGDRISLDYGSELRLLMADPVKGMKLREALELLKEALK